MKITVRKNPEGWILTIVVNRQKIVLHPKPTVVAMFYAAYCWAKNNRELFDEE
jgi:hypothetical protein